MTTSSEMTRKVTRIQNQVPRTEEQKRRIMARYHRSQNKNQARFAREHNLSPSTLNTWLKSGTYDPAPEPIAPALPIHNPDPMQEFRYDTQATQVGKANATYKRFTKKERSAVVKDWKESRTPLREFAKEKDICHVKLWRWSTQENL